MIPIIVPFIPPIIASYDDPDPDFYDDDDLDDDFEDDDFDDDF